MLGLEAYHCHQSLPGRSPDACWLHHWLVLEAGLASDFLPPRSEKVVVASEEVCSTTASR